jgi:hypothetical protein
MAGVVMVASSAGAQQMPAVQWRVDDGGNGHWYQGVQSMGLTFEAARSLAEGAGGDLVTLQSEQEHEFVFDRVASVATIWWNAGGVPRHGPWIGLRQDPSDPAYSEPSGGWRWIDGSPLTYSRWANDPCVVQPTDCFCGGPPCGLNNAGFYTGGLGPPTPQATWGVFASDMGTRVGGLIIEWSTDCNADGIVDFGQCRDGTLPDYDGNNIPDCCENGESCVVGTYPVQWRVGEGGNGHWYRVVIGQVDVTWVESRGAAEGQGGHLATLNSLAENAWVHAMVIAHPAAFMNHGPWLGGSYGDQGWQWVTGEPWRFTAWTPENPSGDGTGMGYWEITNPASASWNDAPESNHMVSSVVEWSADCNSDGIVDYGQILAGDFTDANSNGIPDVCEVPSCIDADLNPNGIVNGADLGALLAFWGPVSPAFPRADINGDGNVNGADLGILLSLWGPCGG